MRIKDASINPFGMRVELLFALGITDGVYREEGVELVITSLNDGHHSHQSFHYSGNAADLRIWHLADPAATVARIKERVGPDYDIILEKDHIHIEYQPRRRT